MKIQLTIAEAKQAIADYVSRLLITSVHPSSVQIWYDLNDESLEPNSYQGFEVEIGTDDTTPKGPTEGQ